MFEVSVASEAATDELLAAHTYFLVQLLKRGRYSVAITRALSRQTQLAIVILFVARALVKLGDGLYDDYLVFAALAGLHVGQVMLRLVLKEVDGRGASEHKFLAVIHVVCCFLSN